MPAAIEGKNKDIKRRKTHRKSRTGCRNCRLRSVKCDESKPECKKCKSYGFCCNFDTTVPDLQMALGGGAIQTMDKTPPPAPVPDIPASLCLGEGELDRLLRFQKRTALSIGHGRGSRVFQDLSMDIAFTHPYVMHIIQAMTSVHDRYLSNSSLLQTPEESYHLSQAAALFNKQLSKPVKPVDQDAIWATALMLGCTTCSIIETLNPEEAWPLAPPAEEDLDWLRVSELKKVVWEVANPMRKESAFYDPDLPKMSPPGLPISGIDNIPTAFLPLFELDSSSTSWNNPYYTAVQCVVLILFLPCSRANLMKFLSYLRYMEPAFKHLLEQRDSRALLLMAYWYSKLRYGTWWIARRAAVECQAICIYLERYHADEALLQQLLQYPKAFCEMESNPGSSSLYSKGPGIVLESSEAYSSAL